MSHTQSPRELHEIGAKNGADLVQLEHLRVWFPIKSGLVLDRHVGDIRAVDDVSLTIKRGETVGLVGESGSGKSTVGRTILRLYKPTDGRILFDGTDISQLNDQELRPPSACPFQPRCRFEVDLSRREVPQLVELEPGHKVACFNPVPVDEWDRARAAATASA